MINEYGNNKNFKLLIGILLLAPLGFLLTFSEISLFILRYLPIFIAIYLVNKNYFSKRNAVISVILVICLILEIYFHYNLIFLNNDIIDIEYLGIFNGIIKILSILLYGGVIEYKKAMFLLLIYISLVFINPMFLLYY